MYKIRFNLGRGERYMKWKVEDMVTKEVEYLDPEEFSITLLNCKLHNNSKRSEKIFIGENKSVCAWVLCEDIIIDSPHKILCGERIKYNPRLEPNWVHNNENVDGELYPILITYGKSIYYTK